MALARYEGVAQDAAGNVIPNATVEVRRDQAGRPVVPLFSDRNGTVPLGNPITTNERGQFGFHAPGGTYYIRVFTGSSQAPFQEYTRRYQAVGTAAERDVEELASSLNSGMAIFGTFDGLELFTPEVDNVGARVINDPDPGLNGDYLYIADVWVKQRGLPDTLARMEVTGGTANTIDAAILDGVDPANVLMFFITPTESNTGPATINGIPVLSSLGLPLAADELIAGYSALLINNGGSYVLWSDPRLATTLAAVNSLYDATVLLKADTEELRDDALVSEENAAAAETAAVAARAGSEAAQAIAEQQAILARQRAEASGSVKFFDTVALATAGLGALPADQVIEVHNDETRNGQRSRFVKESGVLVYKTAAGMDVADNVTPIATGAVPLPIRSILEYELTGAMFGMSSLLADNSAQLQAALDASGTLKKRLTIEPGTYVFTASVTIPDNANFRGSGSLLTRLQKNFVTTGTEAFLAPANLTTTGAVGVTIANIEIGASAYLIGGVKTNKLLWVAGENWQVNDVRFKTWSGWACSVGGNNLRLRDLVFEDPLLVSGGETTGNGTDGLHIAFGSNIRVKGVTGMSSDDFIAVATPLTGGVADRDISDVIVEDVYGESEAARLVVVGIWNAALTASVRNVQFRNVNGKGGSATGAILVSSLNAAADGVSDIFFDGLAADCSLLQSGAAGINVRGTGPLQNIVFRNGRVFGATIDIYGLRAINGFDGLTVEDMVFDNSGSSLAAFSVDTPADARRLRARNLVLICGSGDGFSGPASSALLHDSDVEVDVRNIANGKRGVTFNGIVDSRFKIKTAPAVGATTAIGLREQANGTRNVFHDCDFSAMTGGNTAIELAQTDSAYRNVLGFATRSKGTATVASGTTSIIVSHGLARTPGRVTLRPSNSMGAATKYWVNAVGGTNFTINVNIDPGVTTATFAWEAASDDAS